ncbi:MAG: CHAP domain-containing protein [Spirochaetales bacterium]|nr:MAG: CHAP domain-containing protein [Spirochaetales bacterium]
MTSIQLSTSITGPDDSKPRRARGTILALAFFFPLASCASFGAFPHGDAAYPFPEHETYATPAISEAQRLIAEGGPTLVGKKSLVVNGVTYPNDCTGVVRAAYAFADIDLAYRFTRYGGNGVRRLFMTLQDRGLLYAVRYPAPADLIFWDNTYDADGDRIADDELTHVGVVISVNEDGSIYYLHYHYRNGPVIERMNLTRPDDESIADGQPANSILRMRGSPPGPGSNAAQLFRVFGKGYELVKAGTGD